MEVTKAIRQAGVLGVIGLGAAALWLGSAAILVMPRAAHAQDGTAVSGDNGATDDNITVDDNDDGFGADAAVASPDATTPISLLGSWSGVATDNRHGSGTMDIDFTTQVKNTVQGTWASSYGDQTSLGGSTVGKVKGKSLSLVMDDPTVSRKCRIKLKGKVTVDQGVAEEIKGKYSLTGCFKKNSKGTFDLTPVS